MTKRLDDDEKVDQPIWSINEKRNRNQTIINESGFYNAVIGSKKPEAKKFKKWVTSEVLPSIRKTGSYSKSLTPAEQLLQSVQLTVDIERRQKKLEENNKQISVKQDILDAKIEGVVGGSKFYTILGYINTLDYQENVDIKQAGKLGRRASKLSKEWGYNIGSAPDVRFGTVNTYHEDVLDKIFD